MKTDLFDYPLPARLIAQTPAARRDESRLLVVHRATRQLEHRRFPDLGAYLRPGDTLFRNNAAVIPARLHARRPTGGQVECLLLRPAPGNGGAQSAERGAPASGGTLRAERGAPESALRTPPSSSRAQPSAPSPPAAGPGLQPSAFSLPPSADWWCLLRPGKKLPVGAQFANADAFIATVLEWTDDGLARVQFITPHGEDLLAVAERLGEMPLPPYITGRTDDESRRLDRERYQTVYADRTRPVAAAAPTAGLHFTPELLAQLESAGLRFADLTLHVGLGTFRPITAEHVEDHPIHREVYEIPAATQAALLAPTGRRIAVGTTAVRSIEDFMERKFAGVERGGPLGSARGLSVPSRPTRLQDAEERAGDVTLHPKSSPSALQSFSPWLAEAGIFIYPPRDFRGVDALVTNFHQPRSTLLCLVAAFLTPGSTDGIDWLKTIYAEAISREYRFLSYGDAMLIL